MNNLIGQIDLIELGKTLGVPAFVLFCIFLLAFWYVKAMMPIWKDDAKADVELKNTLNKELPKIAANTEKNLNELRELHKRHDETQKKQSSVAERVEKAISIGDDINREIKTIK